MNYLSDLIVWGSERDGIDLKLYEEIDGMPLSEIFKLYDDVTSGEQVLDRKKYNHVKAVIADKFELPQRDIILPFISELCSDLANRIDELEKNFRAHKHKTFGAGYSEKPSW